jgi:hypothetical protein
MRKPPETLGFTKNGAGHGVRTRDIQLGKQGDTAQKSLQTLGETEVNTKGVTQSVTHNTDDLTLEILLQIIQNLSKEDLIRLLAEVIQKR